MAVDAADFAFRLSGGEFFDLANGATPVAAGDARLATAEQLTDWLGRQLDVNMDRIEDAGLASARWDEVWSGQGTDDPLYTFTWEGMEWDIRVSAGGIEFVDQRGHGMHNAAAPIDIDDNGVLAPLDALLVINFLNSSPTRFLPNRVPSEMDGIMLDVSGDRWVTPIDALMVVNDLNDGGSGEVERRIVATDDYFSRILPINATEFPVSEIDVLENDTAGGVAADGSDPPAGVGLRVVAVGPTAVGMAEIVVAADGSGRTLVRYTPGENFRKFDFFTYTIEDAAGNRAEATAYVGYEIDSAELVPFGVAAPAMVQATSPGGTIEFRDASGNGLISIQADRNTPGSMGVLLNFQPNEPPYGLAIAGTLTSDVVSLTATFYPQLGGEAWITGPVDQVNAILAGLRFEPAPGFSAPDGISMNIMAFLYTPIGASAGFASGSVSLVVPQDPLAPIANGDFLQMGSIVGTVRLDVLANDTSPTGSPLRIVSVSKLAPVVGIAVETSFGATIAVDTATNKLLFRPGLFGTYEQFVYVVSDAEGRLSQGKVAVTFND